MPVQVGRDVVLIDDSYNANPASMKASIRAAAEIAADQKRRLVLVLGEMRELGVAAEAGHDEVGGAARESGASVVISVGPLAERISRRLEGSAVTHAHAANAEDASALARQWVMPWDLVLVKGSRGIGTDAVVRALTAHLGSESVAAQSAGGTP
ncbi:MAG: cyanophycin synthetase [Polyangiaceae bacterium]